MDSAGTLRSPTLLHAAGIGDKGLVRDVRPPRVSEVLTPKAIGAFNLHAALVGHTLDRAIYFSSVASGVGQGWAVDLRGRKRVLRCARAE